jgi:hypothetical protein
MTLEDYIWCSVAALLGWALHTLVKMRSLDQKAKAAKETFNIGKYFLDEKFSIGISILSIAFLLIVLSEVFHFNPKIAGIEVVYAVRTLCTVWGYASNDLVIRLLGGASKKLNAVIDEKTK